MASAQNYAQITELSKRVADWEDKVLPRLEEEEKHAPFDINTYGSSVIDNLDRGHTVQFQRLVQGKPVYEICRTFLASLMLVEITFITFVFLHIGCQNQFKMPCSISTDCSKVVPSCRRYPRVDCIYPSLFV